MTSGVGIHGYTRSTRSDGRRKTVVHVIAWCECGWRYTTTGLARGNRYLLWHEHFAHAGPKPNGPSVGTSNLARFYRTAGRR